MFSNLKVLGPMKSNNFKSRWIMIEKKRLVEINMNDTISTNLAHLAALISITPGKGQ